MISSPLESPAGFDKSFASEAAALVTQAYAQYTAFKSGATWSLQGDYENLAPLSAKPTGAFAKAEPFGFVARNKSSNHVVVVFRGTESPEDWLSNASFKQTAAAFPASTSWGNVEDGFWKLYQQCSPSIRNAVKSAGAGVNIFVTGHSLGGALATLAAADLAVAQIPAATYTFASPRVGDPAFAIEFNKSVPTCWRVVNTEDIVTTVPLATPKISSTSVPLSFWGATLALARNLDFEHVGRPVCFTTHAGSITANHEMAAYINALSA